MAWIIIIVIFIVAFGPLLWLMPTPRERRLARLRQQALQAGLRVELGRLPRSDPTPDQRVTAGGRALDLSRECAVYQQPLAKRLRHLPPARVLRGDLGAPAWPGWSFELGAKPEHPRLGATLDALAALVDTLPDDVIALEWRGHEVGAYWLESPGSGSESVPALASKLAAAAAALGALDASLEPATDPGNI
ncbi:MAG: hypothetical protein RIB46_12820 [Pseudomonadales bacterium]